MLPTFCTGARLRCCLSHSLAEAAGCLAAAAENRGLSDSRLPHRDPRGHSPVAGEAGGSRQACKQALDN